MKTKSRAGKARPIKSPGKSVGTGDGSASGLRITTLKRYAKSELLERDDSGVPIYMHHQRCPSFCDFACNGAHGDHIAADIENLGKPNNSISHTDK